MSEMKGAAFYSMLEAIEEIDGKEGLSAVLNALPEQLGSALRDRSMSRVGWYPIEEYSLLHDAIQAALGGGDLKARELGRRSTEIDTRGLLRYVLAIPSPALLIKHANRVFGSYIRGGVVTATRRNPGAYDLAFSNMGTASRYILAEWEGGIALLLERAGAKNVRVRRVTQFPDKNGFVMIAATWADH